MASLKSISLNVFIISIAFLILYYSQSYLVPWRANFDMFFYVTTAVGVVFSAQFNQSRFSLLSLFLLALYFSNFLTFPILSSWQGDESWQLLSIMLIFSYLAWCKDRGLMSMYTLHRAIVFVLCIAISYGYLYFVNALVLKYPQATLLGANLKLVAFYVPIAICFLVILATSLVSPSLFLSAVFITTAISFVNFLGLWPFTWLITLLLLSAYFVICVVISTYFLAYRDELTGLASRRALYQKSLSLSRKYSVAMMDIDHFKKFNDTYGHDVGDQVLKLVAAQLAKVKSGGRVFRYGGEEFTVIFPRKETAQIVHELETLRLLVANYPIVLRDKDRPKKETKQSAKKGKASRNKNDISNNLVSVTISIGVVSAQPNQKFDEVMKAADKKLYEAKGNGRNNVTS